MTNTAPRTAEKLYAKTFMPRLRRLKVDGVLRLSGDKAPGCNWVYRHAHSLGIQIIRLRVHPDVLILRVK